MTLKHFFKRATTMARYPSSLGLLAGLGFMIRSCLSENARVTPRGMKPLHVRTRTSDLLVFEHVFVTNEFDSICKNLSPASFIIDAGANAGYTTARFAASCPGARIIALEPEPENHAQLLKNTGGYPNVTALNAALWCDNTPLKVVNPGKREHGFQVRAADGGSTGYEVPSHTVPDLMRMAGAEKIDLLKIDIESAEYEVFNESCKDWIHKVDTISIELHDKIRPGCASRFFAAIAARNYHLAIMGEKVVIKFLNQ